MYLNDTTDLDYIYKKAQKRARIFGTITLALHNGYRYTEKFSTDGERLRKEKRFRKLWAEYRQYGTVYVTYRSRMDTVQVEELLQQVEAARPFVLPPVVEEVETVGDAISKLR